MALLYATRAAVAVHTSHMSQGNENPYDSPATVPIAERSSFALPLLAAVSLLAGAAMLILVFVIGPFVWILRDGLGPDATNSTWMQAMSRMFWTFYWGPATLAATFIFLGVIISATSACSIDE